MKALITGANGQLGKALANIFPDAVLVDSKTLDITDLSQIKEFNFQGIDVIINAAAYTAVDEAEKLENLTQVWSANSQGPANLTWLASSLNIPIVHISTDYVFDGTKKGPYTEKDLINPLGIYAKSKAAGDLAVSSYDNSYIIRTSWVIGDGNNFVRIMEKLAANDVKPSVVDDQFGRLTFTDDIANGIKHLLDNSCDFGLYNLTSSGDVVSWFEVAKTVFELSGRISSDVSPTSTEEYFKSKPNIAPRPRNSFLEIKKINNTGSI